MWYWNYQLKIWNEIDEKFETRSGILCAENLVAAAEELDEYYGDEICEIQMLKAITDGIFDFQTVMEDPEFDYTINRKL